MLATDAPCPDLALDSARSCAAFGDWSCSAHLPGAIAHPDQLAETAAEWLPANVPGTVASALAAQGRWDFEHPVDIDARDWWYRTTFSALDHAGPCELVFDGLATLAEVWLNGSRLLQADNMFRSYRVDVSELLQAENELVIGFRSLAADLQQKRPRPRWKTALVSHQQLRWRRTTLLGHIPGWSPPVPAVGPWRDIRLETSVALLTELRLAPSLKGTDGVVTVQAEVRTDISIAQARLRVERNGTGYAAGLSITSLTTSPTANSAGIALQGELHVPQAAPWWPHTQGEPALYECTLDVKVGSEWQPLDTRRIGFRSVAVDRQQQDFQVRVNGESVYCRGACWSVSDIFTLDGTEESLRRDLQLARDAGANLLRVGGTMIYESERFYRLCDELGLLVWQDFMFANMDYPVADEAFLQNVTAEATQQLQRLAAHPCVAIYCGNSEIEQQAAMLGMPRDAWTNPWFAETLPQLCAAHHPAAEYVRSTPSGGVLPFQPEQGVSHFYGIGAYRRPLAELRQAGVRFTPECLGFSNLPEPSTTAEIMGGAHPVTHHPRWKQRVPRDTGAGWDFEDIRDHYLRELYGVDPVALRSSDMPRYLQLSRTVSGEMMARTFAEWRSGASRNRGALVWFYKDLWPAAGWGVVDSTGLPKPAYYYLKRSWHSRQLTLTDEGLNGLHLHAINETAAACDVTVEVLLLKEPRTVIARQERTLTLEARGRQSLSADELLGSFYDVNYAYRFGPAQHDVVVATLYDSERRVLSEACHVIRQRDPVPLPASMCAIDATIEAVDETTWRVGLQSDIFLHGVRLTASGFLPDDNYLSLAPGRRKPVLFRATGARGGKFRVDLEALNLDAIKSFTPSAVATRIGV